MDAKITPDGAGGAIVTWRDRRSGNYEIYAQRVSASGAVQWTTAGVALCTAGGSQWDPQIAPDGSGGAIVTWKVYRSELYSDIFAQRVSASGAVLWTTEGVALCTATNYQSYPQIAPDGSGGAIVTWEDYRGGNQSDIYAQRVSASGAVQWTTDGVRLCSAERDQIDVQIAADGSGGAIVTWQDRRSGHYFDIYAQRVSAGGAVHWTTDGVPLCTAGDDQESPQITPDESGGAIVTWKDERSGNSDIYAQRVSASGAVHWTTDGVPLCTADTSQSSPQLAPDGAGGAIVTWGDSRSGEWDSYAQRVNAGGAVQWTIDGVPLCTAPGIQVGAEIVPDGSGGAIVTWSDYRSGEDDVYAQQVSASGAVQWTPDGVPLCVAAGRQGTPQIAPDGSGGAIVTWQDNRSGFYMDYDIYAQRVSASGAVQWTPDGVPLCAAGSSQQSPQIAAVGSGGAIVTWHDERNGNYDIYAQRVSANGEVLWTTAGVSLCTAGDDQRLTQVIPDDSEGAIVTWQDARSGDYHIYAQRVSASGAVLWTTDGVPLCTAGDNQWHPQIAPDDSGGAIVTWTDSRNGDYDIYAQRVSASGVVLWTTDGVPLCAAARFQSQPQIAPDGLGGAIVTWMDSRSGNYSDIYAQRVSGSGAVQWTIDGVPLCAAANHQEYPEIEPDGSGGAIITWQDSRSGIYYDIYAQRVSAGGAAQWATDGVPLCTAGGDQYAQQIEPDDSGGAIVTWMDSRSGNDDIYAQRVSASGAVQWTADGVPLCTTGGDQWLPQIAPDDLGGAIVTWADSRSGDFDIYAQRVSASGAVQWTADGVPLCTAVGHQELPQIAPDGSGCAIVTWEDPRSGEAQIYAQRTACSTTSVTGTASRPWPTGLLGVAPNPSTGTTTVRYMLAEVGRVRMEVLDAAGRRVWELQAESAPAGAHTAVWDGRSSAGAQVGAGIYYLRLSAAEGTWTRPVVLLR